MGQFEEASSVNTYIDPSYLKNPSKINSSYYNIRGIPKNISISKQQDFTDLTVRHNKVPIVDFSSQNYNDLNYENTYKMSNTFNSNVQTSNLVNKTTNSQLEQLQQKNNIWMQQHQEQHDQINRNQDDLKNQILSLSRDKDNIDRQIQLLQRQVSASDKKIELLKNFDVSNENNRYFEQINIINKEIQTKQDQLCQRQQSRDSVFEKKLNLLAEQIGNLEKNMKNKCNAEEKKDVTQKPSQNQDYFQNSIVNQSDNYFDVPETRYVHTYNYVQPQTHCVTRYSYVQPEIQSTTTHIYSYPEQSYITECVDYSPARYKYSYTDNSTRYTSPYRHCIYSNSSRFIDSDRHVKQIRYSSPSPIRRHTKCQNIETNFKKFQTENQPCRQYTSRGQLLAETTTNAEVKYISNTQDRISYRKLTPEIYKMENPEFSRVLETSKERNPHLVIYKNRYSNQYDIPNNNQQKQVLEQNMMNQNRRYNESIYQDNNKQYENGGVKVVKRTRTRSPVSRFIKQFTQFNYNNHISNISFSLVFVKASLKHYKNYSQLILSSALNKITLSNNLFISHSLFD